MLPPALPTKDETPSGIFLSTSLEMSTLLSNATLGVSAYKMPDSSSASLSLSQKKKLRNKEGKKGRLVQWSLCQEFACDSCPLWWRDVIYHHSAPSTQFALGKAWEYCQKLLMTKSRYLDLPHGIQGSNDKLIRHFSAFYLLEHLLPSVPLGLPKALVALRDKSSPWTWERHVKFARFPTTVIVKELFRHWSQTMMV